MAEPRERTIEAAAAGMRAGALTAEGLVASCLARIRAREPEIRAWVEISAEEALEEARQCDREAEQGRWRGPLHGIPVGVKDIIDVGGMWTRAGSPAYPARLAGADAPAIARLRRAGAIFLGKTETTPFANNDPTVTRNPWNPAHTPGGSSSGSGAAVADRMCPLALGTQTGGSLLRPAAYNGIVGFKATYGLVSNAGVLANSWSLDHVGIHVRTVADAALVWPILREEVPRPFAAMPVRPSRVRARVPGAPPRLGHLREYFESESSPDVRDHLAGVLERLRSAGAEVVDLAPPPSLRLAIEGWSIIKGPELYASHRPLFEAQRDRYPPKLRDRLERGAAVPGHRYAEALQHRLRFQEEMAAAMADVDAVVMPVASTTAPLGLGSTGSSAFNRPWTISGFPAMSLPTGLDGLGLPFGMQVAALPFAEAELLDVAAWCASVLAFMRSPTEGAGSPPA